MGCLSLQGSRCRSERGPAGPERGGFSVNRSRSRCSSTSAAVDKLLCLLLLRLDDRVLDGDQQCCVLGRNGNGLDAYHIRQPLLKRCLNDLLLCCCEHIAVRVKD